MWTNPLFYIITGLLLLLVSTGMINYGFSLMASNELQRVKGELNKGLILIQDSTTNLKERTDALLKATYYTQELSQTINEIWFKVSFKKDIDIAEIYPFKIVIDMYPPLDVKTKIRCRFLIESKGGRDSRQRLLPYFNIKVDNTSKGEILSQGIMYGDPMLSGIVVPLALPNQHDLNIKDLHTEPFIVLLPENIIKIADRIQLYVNGWQILDQAADDVAWVSDGKGKVLDNIGDVSDLKRSAMKSGIPYSLWVLNLYDQLPNKIEGMPYKETPAFSSVEYKT